MNKKALLILLIGGLLSTGIALSPVKSETKFVSGYTDGISTYAVIESDGTKYKTDEMGSRTNMNLWNKLSDADRKQLMKYYWSPNTRKADFGAGSGEMASWANDDQGWTKLVDALKQKRANASYPDLKAYYEKPFEMPEMPNVACTEQIQYCDTAKEAQRLYLEITGNQQAGSEIYKKLVDVKWDQVSVAVKGISANLIPVIVDNFMVAHITNGAKQMSQLIAQLYQFADQTRQFAQNNPNDAATLIKKLDTLCEMMETDARTAMTIVEKDKERLQQIYTQLAKLCEEDVKNKQKFEEAKQKSLQSLMHAPVANTGLVIISRAEKEEDRIAEIAAQARAILNSLGIAMSSAYKEAQSEFEEISQDYASVKNPIPINVCNGQMPENVDSSCFKMYYSVKEIQEWEKDFPRGIAEIQAKLANSKANLVKAKDARLRHAEKIKSYQSRINEVIQKYSGYIGYGAIDDNIDDKIGYYNPFIDALEKEIPNLEIALSQAEDGEKIVKDGLKKRIDREVNDVRPYNSLEANFVNSLSQIRESVYNIDKIYGSEELITLNQKAHKAYLNLQKIKEVRNKISFLPSQEEKDKEITAITDRLKAEQKEANHQIKRLIAGQNNALYDCQRLQEFLEYYTDGLVYTVTGFVKVKQDVNEVTGVKLRNIYYDIVEDWQNGDYSLWMVGNGSSLRWWLDAESMSVDIDYIVELLNGKNQYYNSLEAIINEIKTKKADLLAMDGDSFGKKFNEYSSDAYKIIQNATNSAEETDQVKKNYITILNMLTEIHSVILTRERVKEALPVFTKDIQDANNMLSIKGGERKPDYENMILKLQEDTKEGTQAYYAKDAPALAPLFSEISNLIVKLQDAIKQTQIAIENNQLQKVQELYASFKNAYDSKSESQLINLISKDWDAGDGTTLSDLEENLKNNFTVFDSVQYQIINMNITKQNDNTYRVSYDVEITGKIYDNDITHKEKSSVNEIVVIEANKAKIYKTVQGRFWYIE